MMDHYKQSSKIVHTENLVLPDPSKLVIWTGAGIDTDQPTNLPLGNALTRFILERFFPDNDIRLAFVRSNAIPDKEMYDFLWSSGTVAEALFDSRQKKLNKFFQDMNSQHGCNFPLCDGGIRLESVLEVVREFETTALKKGNSLSGEASAASGNVSVLDGFRSFAEAKPNETHYNLAQLIHKGSVVVTMNYDLCIQAAFNELYRTELTQKELSDHVYAYQDSDGSGVLYFLHGVADTPESIGITLNTIDKPFPEEFVEKITEKAQSGSTFLFLGYSCGDDFDVNEMFRAMEKKGQLSTSSAVCVIYPGDEKKKNSKPAKPSFAQQQMLDLFPKNCYIALKLPEFFATYYKDIFTEASEYRNKTDYNDRDNGWWEKSFIKPDPDLIPRLNSQLDYMLGIDRKYKDKMKRSSKLEDWHYRFYSGYDGVKRKVGKVVAPDWEDNHKIRLSTDESIALLDKPEGRSVIYSDPDHPKINWKTVSAINHRVKESLRLYSVNSKLVDSDKLLKLYDALKSTLSKNSVNDFVAPRARFVFEYDMAILTYLVKKDWKASQEMIFNTMREYTRTSELRGLDRGVEIYMDLWNVVERSGEAG